MRISEFNNFELLLITASEAVSNDYADKFMAIDTTGIEMSPNAYIKMQRYIRKNGKYKAICHPAKVILIAALIAMSIAFTACLTIPQIRESIKNVVVQWYDDHFAIRFSNDPDAINMTQPQPEEAIPQTPPKTIEKKVYAMYIPNDYKARVELDTLMCYQINYVDENNNPMIMLKQRIIESEMIWNDSEGVVPKEITINGHKAYLLTYQDEPNVYTMIWQDYYYQYNIYGMFANEEQVISFCENLKLR